MSIASAFADNGKRAALMPYLMGGFPDVETSARIGDARSSYEDGVLSRVNASAASLGLAPGMTARDAVALLRRAFLA